MGGVADGELVVAVTNPRLCSRALIPHWTGMSGCVFRRLTHALARKSHQSLS
jgi:hypothetical protein